MSKIETSMACIECGNKLLEKIYPMLLEYNDNFDKLSNFEKETYNTILGSQFALVCEYYLKGLFIPNIKVVIPEELKTKIDKLTEEQELMIIVSDDEKIRKDPLLSKLDRKELRLLLSINSLKSFGHSLISLLGTETFDDNKRVVLPNNIRKYILNEMKSRLYNPADKTFEDRQKFRNYINTPIKYAKLKWNKDRDIEIQYFKQNPVGKLYERLGFVPSGETEFHYQMMKPKQVIIRK